MTYSTNFLVDSVIPILDQLTCVEVRVCFSGGGDSGELYAVHFKDKDGNNVYPWNAIGGWQWSEKEGRHVMVEPDPPVEPEPTITVPCKYPGVRDGKQLEVGDDLPITLTGAVEEYAYEEIMGTGIDWYNDDGGSGEWVLSKDDNGAWSRSLVVDVNIMHTETEHDSIVEICPPAKRVEEENQ